MSREPKIIDLQGHKVIIGYWDVDKSLEIWAWLVKTFSEGFANLVAAVGDDSEVSTQELFTAVVGEFTRKLEPKEYVRYAKWIVDGTRVDGGKLDPKDFFFGKIGLLHQLIIEVLVFQYADFLDVSAFGGIVEALSSKNPTTQES